MNEPTWTEQRIPKGPPVQRIGKYLMVRRSPIEEKGKTCYWHVFNHRDLENPLGAIYWSTQWRQYIFDPCYETVYSADCLRDIATFLDRSRTARRVPEVA